MFSKILVATDLSEASEKVVCALGGLRKLGTTEVVLLYCLNIRDAGTLAPGLMELTRPSLDRHKKLLEDQGFKVTAKMVLGLPHIEIIRQADEHDCSLIVVGSHGRTMASEMLLGGVASAVIQSVTRPVLIVQLRLKDEAGETVCEEVTCDPADHVLFTTDFSDTAERAFTYVEQIVKSGARRVTLLHVQDKGRIYGDLKHKIDEFNRIDRERLERMERNLKEAGASEVSIELPYGLPKQEIVKRLEQGDLSLIVMGTQGRGFFGKLLMGSVAYHVARNTTVPTMLVPPLR
ncbi:MAG: universal stress protein [Thermodesulfobacteriota bacterium]